MGAEGRSGKVAGEHADECCYLTKYLSERPQTSSHERCRQRGINRNHAVGQVSAASGVHTAIGWPHPGLMTEPPRVVASGRSGSGR
jgi:hypothetical protein